VKNETTFTFYGGVDEIGGNKIVLRDKDTQVFFDFGMSFAIKKQFYSPPFLSPKSEKSLQEESYQRLMVCKSLILVPQKSAGSSFHMVT
jgi:hypothetical protein